MPRRSPLWLVLLAALGLALLPALPAGAQTTVGLFVIERSKNANVVHYDAQLGKDGAIDPKEPVVAYWILKAEDGRREGLTFLERRVAYGFDVAPGAQPGTFRMQLSAFKDRPLLLEQVGGRWRAVAVIAGKSAFLDRLFIKTDEGGVTPTVLFVDLFGEDAAGKPVQEHIVKG